MERPVAPLRKSSLVTLKLPKEAPERHAAARKDTKIPVQRKDAIARFKRCRYTDTNSFLPDAREPFTQLSLTKKQQHSLFDEPRREEKAVEMVKGFG
jgi:hypothetical protein